MLSGAGISPKGMKPIGKDQERKRANDIISIFCCVLSCAQQIVVRRAVGHCVARPKQCTKTCVSRCHSFISNGELPPASKRSHMNTRYTKVPSNNTECVGHKVTCASASGWWRVLIVGVITRGGPDCCPYLCPYRFQHQGVEGRSSQ